MRLTGRRIVGGEGGGSVLASDRPLSFLGGVNEETGVVRDPASSIRGESVGNRVFALPYARGSTVGSYVLYGLRKRGVAPVAILASTAETILAVGAVLADVPLVDRIPIDLLRTGDRARVDAARGVVDLPEVVERSVVTAFLERDRRILVVRRSERVGTFRGKWSGISGYLEGEEDAEGRARQEVVEETGIRDMSLLSRGPVVRTRSEGVVFAIHPFRFHAPRGDVHLDWENVESHWVLPAELGTLDAVPKLADAYRATLPTPS